MVNQDKIFSDYEGNNWFERNKATIAIRKANFSDIEFLWYLRNQPDVYKYFRKGRPVTWKEHINWIIPVILGTSSISLYVIQKAKRPVGQVKVDYKTSDIGISILKEFRNKGIATRALAIAIREIKREKKAEKLIAEIQKKNLSSIKLFEKLGFKIKTKKGKWIKYILKL